MFDLYLGLSTKQRTNNVFTAQIHVGKSLIRMIVYCGPSLKQAELHLDFVVLSKYNCPFHNEEDKSFSKLFSLNLVLSGWDILWW